MNDFWNQVNQEYQENQKLAELFSKRLKSAGTGENEEECYELIRDRYQKVNQNLSEIQEELDEQAGLNLKPQKAKFPAERAQQIAHSLEDQTVPIETIQRRAQNAVANIANSFCDDFIQKNAEFKSNAGLSCYITRTTTGKCCAWCSQIAGRYEYGKHPVDVFCRHDNCDCIVTYENGKKRQNVWTKKTWAAPDIPDEALNFMPTVFTPEQARAVERQNLQYKGLTIPGKTDIMSTNRKMAASGQNPPDFSKYPVAENLEAVNAIKKTISETLGIDEKLIDLTGIKNTEVLEPFVKRLQKIQADTGMIFPKIIATEVITGDNLCIASYQPIENTFYISSRYFNSKDALTATLKDWAGKNILPAQAKSIAYLAEHETAHMRIPDSLLETDEAKKIWKKRKLLNANDEYIYEYFADATAIYRMNPNVKDSNVIKAIEYLRNGGIAI